AGAGGRALAGTACQQHNQGGHKALQNSVFQHQWVPVKKCKANASAAQGACSCCKRLSGYPQRDHETIDMLLTELQAQQITLVRVLEQTRDNGGLWTAGDAHEATRAARELVGRGAPFHVFVARRAQWALEEIQR